ncbi:MAG: ABC transporter ATP-binding protein [Treponema sp.]|jgi:energy-coupling factor transport system ATP-binding protein|nr:ABC transporter ATP-binding protein [Treponema sp.]
MIEFRNVSFAYGQAENNANCITAVNIVIEDGQCVVFCGKSGCGKTTLTRLINGLIPHFFEGVLSGAVFVDGKEIAKQPLAKTAQMVGSVFQNPRSQFFNVDTTGELTFGCENLGLPVEEIWRRIDEARAEFGLDGLLDRSIFELSSGEKQRIACASVYATGPGVFVLDEPSSNLDAPSVEMLRRILEKLKSAGKTIVVSEHRLYYLSGLADRFVYLEDGRILDEYTPLSLRAMKREELEQRGLRSPDDQKPERNRAAPFFPRRKDSGETIEIKNVQYRYGKNTALDIPSLSLRCGEITAVIGRNGSGKSTLAGCFCGILKHRGTVSLRGKALGRQERIGTSYMVMQDVNHQLFTESVLDELTLNIPGDRKAGAVSILEAMGLGLFADTHPLSLSGGQKQRVAIAGAVCAGKEFFVYDEPTSGQDYQSMIATCDLIRGAAEEALLSLVITHDMEFVLNCCTSVLHLEGGMVKEYYPLDTAGIEKIETYFNAKTGGSKIVQESA